MNPIRVLQVGMGPIGQSIIRFLSERKGFQIISAVDKDPKKAGRDLGEVCQIGKMGIIILDSIKGAMGLKKPDVAIISTTSKLEKVTPQIVEVASYRVPIVSTCEELTYPWEKSKELSLKIDEIAKKYGIGVLGTGVNPGFLMDALPIFLTSLCQRIESIKIFRIQDASSRRVPFQRKIGAGLTIEEFERDKRLGLIRHVGLTESIQMIAAKLGWKLDDVEEKISPVVSEKDINAGAIKIIEGQVLGVQQIGIGYMNNREKISLIFRASVGEKAPEDKIEIFGEQNIVFRIEGGVNGDTATCAITINAIKQVLKVSPGLHTMADIPITSFFSN